jgi:hypothetical protein
MPVSVTKKEDVTVAEAPKRYCSNCGHELRPEDQFCPNCGRPVHRTAQVPTPEANVPVPPPPQTGGTGAAAPEQPVQERGEPVTNPLTWRQFAIVTLLAGFGGLILPALTSWLVIIPLGLGYVPLLILAVLYLANLVFGFFVGYSSPSRNLRVYGFLGLAVGLAQWLGATAYFVSTGAVASRAWLIVYGVAPALIFASIAIVGALVKKGQLSLSAAVLTSAISLVSALIGLLTAIS